MLKIISKSIDEMMNSKEMKDKSQLLLSENELKVLVGQSLYKLAGEKFIEAIMECGGSAPGIIFE